MPLSRHQSQEQSSVRDYAINRHYHHWRQNRHPAAAMIPVMGRGPPLFPESVRFSKLGPLLAGSGLTQPASAAVSRFHFTLWWAKIGAGFFDCLGFGLVPRRPHCRAALRGFGFPSEAASAFSRPRFFGGNVDDPSSGIRTVAACDHCMPGFGASPTVTGVSRAQPFDRRRCWRSMVPRGHVLNGVAG